MSSAAKKPKLGQNFLRDDSLARRIVDALGEIGSRTVVEVGPGPGILTALLARRAGHLIAVELDRVLTAQLRMQYARRPNVEIIEANILDVSLPGLLRTRTEPLAGVGGPPASKVDVVGNLPFYIASEILLHLLEQYEWIEQAVIMVQREVADRIAARPGSRDYGLLSATAQLYAEVEKLFVAPPGAFEPAPKVHSAVLRLRIAPRWPELAVAPRPFLEFLKTSFAQKRKTLANNLKPNFPPAAISAALRAAGARSDARAESLSLENMAAIFRALQDA